MTTYALPPNANAAASASLTCAAQMVAPALDAAVARLSPSLQEPVHHHLAGGGKRVRAALSLLSASAAGATEETGVVGAVAIELIHNFSLIHDDIIDGDTERRHRATVWSEFGIGKAIIAGDALATLAVQVMLEHPTAERVRAAVCLVEATQVMIAGQGDDMAFESRPSVSVAECLDMERGKTSALLACAVSLGAILAGAPDATVAALAEFGSHVGTAFQAVDDLLGISGEPARTGKPVGSDLVQHKKTLPVSIALGPGRPQPARTAAPARRRPLAGGRGAGPLADRRLRRQRCHSGVGRRVPRPGPGRAATGCRWCPVPGVTSLPLPGSSRSATGDCQPRHGRVGPRSGRSGRRRNCVGCGGESGAVGGGAQGSTGPTGLVEGRAGDQRHHGRRRPPPAPVPRYPHGAPDRRRSQVDSSCQRDDGTWATYYGGPPDLSTTIEAYVALRLAGDAVDDPHMRLASTYIREAGGIGASRVFTRIWLALFGQWPWERLPVMPPELMLLPPSIPLNVYDFACWARQTVVALTVISADRPVRELSVDISELDVGPAPVRHRPLTSWAGRFDLLDRLLHVYERRPLRALRR